MAKTMSRRLSRRIMERAEKHKRLVLVVKDGTPTRIFGFEEYQERIALARKGKPWESRRKTVTRRDPLGAVDGKVLGSLRRRDIYR